MFNGEDGIICGKVLLIEGKLPLIKGGDMHLQKCPEDTSNQQQLAPADDIIAIMQMELHNRISASEYCLCRRVYQICRDIKTTVKYINIETRQLKNECGT